MDSCCRVVAGPLENTEGGGPFEELTSMSYKIKVFSATNYRPKLWNFGSTRIKSLLAECWNTQIENRADFERIASVLKAEMTDTEWDCEESYGTFFESISGVET